MCLLSSEQHDEAVVGGKPRPSACQGPQRAVQQLEQTWAPVSLPSALRKQNRAQRH